MEPSKGLNYTLSKNKTYYAVVCGKPRDVKGKIVSYLKKDEKTNMVKIVPQSEEGAKRAELDYEVLDVKEKVSLVKIDLHTGRSHQIRVQMKHIGCPIYGDVRYGGDILAKGHNLALWAFELKLVHPTTKENMTFKVYPPEDKTPWNVININGIK